MNNYQNDELRKVQLTLMEILDEFVRICNKHKLIYFSRWNSFRSSKKLWIHSLG